MARKNYNKSRDRRTSGSKKSRYSPLERLAYQVGQISRGRENPDSLIFASYEAGARERERRPKKTLF